MYGFNAPGALPYGLDSVPGKLLKEKTELAPPTWTDAPPPLEGYELPIEDPYAPLPRYWFAPAYPPAMADRPTLAWA